MLTDFDREKTLEEFAGLYADPDLVEMVSHMPRDINDPDGDVFSEYFDFLQILYSLRSDIKVFDDEDLDLRLMELNELCDRFDYPKDILEVFYESDQLDSGV